MTTALGCFSIYLQDFNSPKVQAHVRSLDKRKNIRQCPAQASIVKRIKKIPMIHDASRPTNVHLVVDMLQVYIETNFIVSAF